MLLPNTQKTVLLNLLINKKQVTELDFNINGYRSRLSELENKHEFNESQKRLHEHLASVKLKEKVVVKEKISDPETIGGYNFKIRSNDFR